MKTLIAGNLNPTAEELQALKALGLDITMQPDELQIVDHPEQYEAIICNFLFQNNPFEKFTNLKYLQLLSAGKDRVPLDYIAEHGIILHNAHGVYSVPMAEWTVMTILEVCKHAADAHQKQREHRFHKDRSWLELSGKRACIIGFGAYGQETAKRLRAFDVEISVVNRTEKASPFVDAWYPLEAMMEPVRAADIVISCIALTDKTRHLYNGAFFSAMKDGVIFVNAARGGLVDESALIEALQSGKLYGAALDVSEQEPLPADHPLWDAPNLVYYPHNSFVGEGNHKRLIELVIRNLQNRSN